MKESIIAKRSFEFGLAVVRFTGLSSRTYENIILLKQIIRSATSIGANIQEALGGMSKKEFVHCMNITKKEERETLYCLKLLYEINEDKREKIDMLINENIELINMLTKIVKTATINSN